MGKGEGKGDGKGKGKGGIGIGFGTDPEKHDELGLTAENTKVRGCTDPLFVLLFLAACAAFGYIAHWGWERGNWRRIVYGADSWDNICGYDNRDRDDMIKSSNAGLDMRKRPHQYYTDPSSYSAPILCVEKCPTNEDLAEQYDDYKKNDDYKHSCDPTDGYCQQFCMASVPGAVRGNDKHPNPYGLYPEDADNMYMTNNHDRGNCYDYDDYGDIACEVKKAANESTLEEKRNEAKPKLDEIGKLFGELGEAARAAASDALGFGETDDWNTGKRLPSAAQSSDGSGDSSGDGADAEASGAKYDWELCKPDTSANLTDTINNPNCPNDGCPKKIFSSYDLSGYTRGIYAKCIPKFFGGVGSDAVDTAAGYVSDLNRVSFVQKGMESIGGAFSVIIYSIGISVGISYLLVFAFRFVVRPLVVAMVVLGWLACLVLLCVLWEKYFFYDDLIESLEDKDQVLESDERNRHFFLWSARIWTFVTAILLLVLLALRKQIWRAATLYMIAARAMFQMPSMLLSPLLNWMTTVCFVAAWCATLIVIAATDTTTEQNNVQYGQGHAFYEERYNYQNFLWFLIFFGLWGLSFIEAGTELSLAICVTTWFKTQGEVPFGMLPRAVYRTIFHHFGTIALGSLIIAICRLMMAIILYIEHKCNEAGMDNGLVKWIMCCMKCCLYCLDRCLKYINRNAYIETALYGYSFCNAAFRAFHTLMANIVQVATTNFIGKLIFFTFKLLVIASVCTGAYYWMQDIDDDSGAIPMIGIPLLVIGVVSYFISGAFTELFEMTADTLLICYCEDRNKNNGTNKPYLSPPELVKNVAKYEKATTKQGSTSSMTMDDKMH